MLERVGRRVILHGRGLCGSLYAFEAADAMTLSKDGVLVQWETAWTVQLGQVILGPLISRTQLNC